MGVFRPAAPCLLATAALLAFAIASAAQTPTLPSVQPPQSLPPGTIPQQQAPPPVVPDPFPATPYPNIPQTVDRPLTPEEQRQLEIQKYDPRNPVNPAKKSVPGEKDTTQAPDRAATSNRDPNSQDNTPLPGSVAESNQKQSTRAASGQGPEVATGNDADTDRQSYTGPAVLSRSYTISRPMELKEVRWSWTVGSSQNWQSGFVTTGANGVPATNGSSFGTTTTFNFSGRHLWKRDMIGLRYGTSYSRFYSANNYSGVNQTVSLDYQHVFTRHLAVNLVQTGAIFSKNYTLENPLTTPGVTVANLNLAASPTTQLLDQRVRQSQTTAGLTWQKSSRLSFSINSTFFAVSYTGAQLTSSIGYSSSADVNYRVSRRATVGAYYSYSSYTYFKHESVSDSNTVGLIYSYSLDRATQLRLRSGVAALESLTLTQVPLNPVFAILVGQSFGVADIYQKTYTTDISGQLVRDFSRRRSANISYARGIAPGNGLLLTSIQETMSASFSASLFRRYHVSLTAGRSVLTAQGNTGSYGSEYAAFTISHAISRGPSANFSVNYSRFNISNMPGLQSQFGISTGVTWGPGPGRLW